MPYDERAIEGKVDIIDGPDRLDLFVALAEFSRGRLVNFEYAHPERPWIKLDTEIVLLGLQPDDGSGRNWFFSGRFESGQQIHGFYSLTNRTGWMEPGKWRYVIEKHPLHPHKVNPELRERQAMKVRPAKFPDRSESPWSKSGR